MSGLALPGNSQLVRSIVDLAQGLGLRTTAEGIETTGQWSQLHGLGCQTGQGFHFARPLTATAATDYLLRQQGRQPASTSRPDST